MANPFTDVAQFNRAAGNAGGRASGAVNWRLLLQAIAHVAEESREMALASDNLEQRIALSESVEESAEAFAGVADAACDLIYVSANVLYALGFDYERLWREVHRTNMSKLPVCPTCYGRGSRLDANLRLLRCEPCRGLGRLEPQRNEQGKILKPADWSPPDLVSIIAEEMQR